MFQQNNPKLEDILNTQRLAQLVQDGFVGAQRHPMLPLTIYNYTHLAQFEGKWGDGVLDYCRGLIVDDKGFVIARPFKKFHNINTTGIKETQEDYLATLGQPTVLEKLDGSLGILWYYEGEAGIATRGSFTSPQAVWATNWYLEHLHSGQLLGRLVSWPDGWTPLFEIIYNENRIVVEYDFEGLVLLGGVKRSTGQEWDIYTTRRLACDNGLHAVKQHGSKSVKECVAENVANREGYVLHYDLPGECLKVKIKFEDYVRLHRIVTGRNPRHVWELLSSGQSLEPLRNTPQHFSQWVHQWEKHLTKTYNEVRYRLECIWAGRPRPCDDPRIDRRNFALHVQNSPSPSALFAMYDGKDPAPFIWKAIEPKATDTLRESLAA